MTRDVIRLIALSLADGCLPATLIRMASSRSSRLDGYVEFFQDAQKYDSQTQIDNPTATRYGFRVASQHAASMCWDLFHLRTIYTDALSMFSCLLTLVCLPTWLVYAFVPSVDLRARQGDGGTA